MKDFLLSLLSEKFPTYPNEQLASVAEQLASQEPDTHQAQALVTKLSEAQMADFLPKEKPIATPAPLSPSPAGEPVSPSAPPSETPSAQEPLDRLIEKSVARAIASFEQRLSALQEEQTHSQRLQALEHTLAPCLNIAFKEQTLKDFARMQFASPTDFDTYLKEKQNAVSQANQEVANHTLAHQPSPLYPRSHPKNLSAPVAAFITQPNEKNTLKGKEI